MANATNWWTCYTAILDAELFERHRGQDSSVEFDKALSGRLSTSEKKTMRFTSSLSSHHSQMLI